MHPLCTPFLSRGPRNERFLPFRRRKDGQPHSTQRHRRLPEGWTGRLRADSMPPPGRLSMEGAAKAQPLTARNHAMRRRARQAGSMPGRSVGAWVNVARPAA